MKESVKVLVKEFKNLEGPVKGALCYGLLIILSIYQSVFESITKLL